MALNDDGIKYELNAAVHRHLNVLMKSGPRSEYINWLERSTAAVVLATMRAALRVAKKKKGG